MCCLESENKNNNQNSTCGLGVVVIDYRREGSRFPLYASCVLISNPDLLSSSETRVKIGQAERITCLNELDVRKSLVESTLQRSKELGLYKLV